MSTVRTFDYSLLDQEPHRVSPQALQVFTGNQVDPSKVSAAYEELRDKTSIPSGFFWIDMERVAAHLRGDTSQVQAALGTGKIRVPLWGGILYLVPHDGIQGGGGYDVQP